MIFWTQVLLAFVAGIIINKLWNSLLYTGYSIMILKNLQDDCVKLMVTSAQSIAEINQLKYLQMHKSGKSEKEIEIQQTVDEYYAKPLRNAVVQNFINLFPARYESILQFYDWDSAYQKMLAILAEGHWAIAQDPSAAPKIIHYGERR